MKRIISIFIAMVITLFSAAPFVFADEDRFTASTDEVASSDFATREQAIACFIRAVGIERFKTDPSILDKFSDKTKVSFALRDDMSAAVYSGLIGGYEDNTLRPQSPITRIEALVILSRALSRTELTENNPVEFSDTPHWAKNQIDRLSAAGIVKGYGDGTIGARDLLTPEQVNILCDRITALTGPAGNFYNYVNEEWLENAAKSTVPIQSGMNSLSQTISSQLTDIIFSLYRRCYNDGEEFEENSAERRIITVYSAAANQGFRDKIGLSPINSLLDTIDSSKSLDELIEVMAELERSGFPTLLSVSADTNPYNSSEYLLSLAEVYLGAGSALLTGADADKNLEAYRSYTEKLFLLSGESAEAAKTDAAAAAKICKELATAKGEVKSGAELILSAVLYNAEELNSVMQNTDIKKYLSLLGFGEAEAFITYDAKLLSAADSLMTEENLANLRAYLKASVLDNSALYLTSDTFSAYCGYLGALYGTPTDRIPSDYATDIVEELLGWELGALYVDTYFSEAAKTSAAELTKKIIGEYRKLITSCTRMSPKGREAALKKLNTMTVNAAYPDSFDEYFSTEIALRPTEDGGNLMEYKMEYGHARNAAYAAMLNRGSKAFAGGWYIHPQTVNAMYDIRSNSITIPAGILQAPFFNPNAEFEENLGAIGTVIAHEISHAFDSKGAKFDENGNLSEQWTVDDYAAFDALCADVARAYDGIRTEGGAVNGQLTLDENLADLAGFSCVLNLAGADNPKLDKLFCSYAKMWREKATPEYEKLMLLTDEHSPAKVRVNRVLSNFDEFLDFYGVTENDGMYLPPESHIDIWK